MHVKLTEHKLNIDDRILPTVHRSYVDEIACLRMCECDWKREQERERQRERMCVCVCIIQESQCPACVTIQTDLGLCSITVYIRIFYIQFFHFMCATFITFFYLLYSFWWFFSVAILCCSLSLSLSLFYIYLLYRCRWKSFWSIYIGARYVFPISISFWVNFGVFSIIFFLSLLFFFTLDLRFWICLYFFCSVRLSFSLHE